MEGVLKCVVQHGRAHVPNRSASTSRIGSEPRARRAGYRHPRPGAPGRKPRVRTGADISFHNQAHNLLTGLLTHVLLSPAYPGERKLRGLRQLIATGLCRRDRMLPEVRMARIIDAIGLHQARKLSCAAAAELLGMSERHFRRLHDTYEAHGAEGIVDRQRGRASGRRAPVDEVAWVVEEFRTRYFDFTAKHLYGVISVKALVQVV